MNLKPRDESSELKALRSLNIRMNLPVKVKNYYTNLEKGFKGEQVLDGWLENLSFEKLVLNDLLLECNHTLFQIDTLLISPDTIYLFEVKNYEGDFFVEDDRWFSASRIEIKNPLLQLKRTESLSRRSLHEFGNKLPIESYLIFVNPEFQLYQAPLNLPIVFPTQLKRFIQNLKPKSSRLKETHFKLAEQLQSSPLIETPYNRLPDYDFNELKKGVSCVHCRSLDTSHTKMFLICKACGSSESYLTAILRTIEEFRVLFPNRKITTNEIYDWCNTTKTIKTIRNVLLENYEKIGQGRSAHYIVKE
ncbi:nuclease-related domain-containing protein [Halalkalibacter alkalisediminis]|uniref:Nuclease-related domain-containing protein n=1 Tax=Halalkalibacter alkalisediminis TaxID=935616 RepID=A0ABV6NKF1_9BACI|nr:nuclease-related domain-containing protein [Halalkalibacter alkalisediminis]